MSDAIRKIVVPIDFSGASVRAANYAATIARALGAHLFLVNVLEGIRPGLYETDDRYDDARKRLEVVARSLNGPGVTTEVRTGRIHERLADAVTDYGADLVVMSTHGRTGLSHLLMGSVAEALIRISPCPVLVLRDCGQAHVHRPAA
jgi:nucleotide-binding universal stress UspA family protein